MYLDTNSLVPASDIEIKMLWDGYRYWFIMCFQHCRNLVSFHRRGNYILPTRYSRRQIATSLSYATLQLDLFHIECGVMESVKLFSSSCSSHDLMSSWQIDPIRFSSNVVTCNYTFLWSSQLHKLNYESQEIPNYVMSKHFHRNNHCWFCHY